MLKTEKVYVRDSFHERKNEVLVTACVAGVIKHG